MVSLSKASISTKILAIIMCITAVVLMVVISVSSFREFQQIKTAKTEQIASITSVLANATNATLLFGADEEAKQFLSGLKEEPEIQAAILYSNSDVFATYTREEGFKPPTLPDFEGSQWNRSELRYLTHVYSDGDNSQLGALLVIAEVHKLRIAVRDSVIGGVVLFILGLALAAFLSSRFHGQITTPVSTLATMAHEVSKTHDYSVRAPKQNEDEIGSLVDSFNFMLETIEQSNELLKQSNDSLQIKVNEKTRDLKNAMEAAQAASRAKSDFLATMSHELRTPMNAILGMASLLDGNLTTNQRQECVGTIQGSSDKLLDLINNILDFTKLESGKLELHNNKFDLLEVVNQAHKSAVSQYPDKEIEFKTEFSPSLKRYITSDHKRVVQVLAGLINNAYKFTYTGEISLRVDPIEVNDAPKLRFIIADTGIGISAEEKDRLFKIFSQVDSSVTRRYGGTGLGLAICKRILDAMDGDISVNSEKGKGSEFTVTIPYRYDSDDTGIFEEPSADPKLKTVSEAPVVDYSKLKLLLVEDTLMNQKVFVQMIRREIGCDVDIAQNGLEGYEKTAHYPYDIVFMDLHMPVMDGITATRKIRDARDQIHQPRIIALTADVQLGIEQEALNAGMDLYLSKPLKKNVLKEKITEIVATGLWVDLS